MCWRNLALTSLLLAGAFGLCTGCGKPASSPGPSSDTAAPPTASSTTATPAVKRVPQTELPVGDYLPPLDDGRLEIAAPRDWGWLPRHRDFVTRFFKGDRNGLPRIEVTVEPNPFEGLESVTADNVEQFARRVAERLEAEDKTLIEDVIPMIIGDVPCARYVSLVGLRLGQRQPVTVERQRLLVLNRGRLYRIDLMVLRETLLQSRDAAYAVCASLKFLDGDAARESAAGESQQFEFEPADEAPAP